MTSPAFHLDAPAPPSLVGALDREMGLDPRSVSSTRSARAVPARLWRKALHAPLRDFLERPGKELRAEIVEIFHGIGGGRAAMPPELPFVIEVLHAGSLIVDDIEDDSPERRGAPCLHATYGVGPALNGANWMYFWAFRLLEQLGLDETTEAAASRLAHRALLDCHYGQALDVSVRASELSEEEMAPVVRTVTELKTGSLFALAASLGALTGGAPPNLVAASSRVGRDFGVALQMQDDLNGVTRASLRHKGREDLALDRPTWIWAWLARALPPADFAEFRVRVRNTPRDALDPLLEEIGALVGEAGRYAVQESLGASLARFVAAEPPASVVAPLRRAMERLVPGRPTPERTRP